MDTAWLIDELAHAGREHLDPAFVRGYDRKQGGPDAVDDVAEFVARGLTQESTVVDLGAGTGQFTLAAAREFGRVIAVDVSPVMLEHLKSRVDAEGLSNVDCVRAGFLTYDHLGEPVDGVYSRNALHQLPDFWKALALERIAALLVSGGLIRLHDLIFDFEPSETAAVFEQWFDSAAADPSTGYTREDIIEHIRTEHSTFRWLFEPMLAAAGFRIETVEFRRGVYATYTCVKADETN